MQTDHFFFHLFFFLIYFLGKPDWSQIRRLTQQCAITLGEKSVSRQGLNGQANCKVFMDWQQGMKTYLNLTLIK